MNRQELFGLLHSGAVKSRLGRQLLVASVLAGLLAFVVLPAGVALAVIIGGYNIDGLVPDPGVAQVSDPFGSVKELGAVNGAGTKVNAISSEPVPMLEFTDVPGKSDYVNVWADTNKDANGDTWLYFAWEREDTTGSTVILWEFQQSAPPVNCDYTGVDFIEPVETAGETALKANCNPWENRQPGDFIIVWDFQRRQQ